MPDDLTKADLRLSEQELELRRYIARLGFWKMVLGTFLVGMAAIIVPAIIQFYVNWNESARKETELRLSQQAAHQQYIKDFFATAINQDIELRIRFASYFANLSGPGQEELWRNYLNESRSLRDKTRENINKLEAQLVSYKQNPETLDNADFDRINRELAWANAEIGYVPTERSAVVTTVLSGRKCASTARPQHWCKGWQGPQVR